MTQMTLPGNATWSGAVGFALTQAACVAHHTIGHPWGAGWGSIALQRSDPRLTLP